MLKLICVLMEKCIYIKGGLFVKFDGSLYWVFVIGVFSGVGRFIGCEVDIGVGDELGEGVELEVGSIVLLIKMSNMKSMWRLMIVSIEMLTELLVMKLVDSIMVG